MPRSDMPSPRSSGDELEQSARFEFPKMLYKMLHDCTFDEQYCKIVSWRPHGLAFKVHNRDELEKILPLWFREKYESFRCLLEQWGFLKLTRGGNRGCWYHKEFYHRYNHSHYKIYEKSKKEDFIKAMPEYLSFRDEPDLEKETNIYHRISLNEMEPMHQDEKSIAALNKNKSIFALRKNNLGSTKDKDKSTISANKRYNVSTLKECRYCHELFAARGFSRHEDACKIMSKRKRIHESDTSEDYDNDSDRNTLSESDDDDEDNDGMIKCRYCRVYYSKYGVKKHEMKCMLVNRGLYMSEDSDTDDSMKLVTGNTNRVPCSFCGVFFTKTGVVLHERTCKIVKEKNDNSTIGPSNKKDLRGGDIRNNNRRSVLLDDSSVGSADSADSIQSGCKICGFDDDHANLLLCEGCDTEVHTYCLTPPLEKVPVGDWFCDTCVSRMKTTKEEFAVLLKRVPPDMAERFGEICFAKSAENAHWWPALIFDPRSFLHNREVVNLAWKYLGKRHLVFFFENQDAFAAIPETWIKTWEEGVEKDYDKGKSVRNASKSRKQQFERAMNFANEAFEDITSRGSKSSETEFDSPIDSDIEDHSLLSRIPRVIGGNSTIFDLDPDFDWKPVRDEVRKEVDAVSPSDYPEVIDNSALRNISQRAGGKSQAQVTMGGKLRYIGLFTDQRKAAFAIKLFRQKMKDALHAYEKGCTDSTPQSGLDDTTKLKKANSRFASDGVESSLKSETSFGTFTDKMPKTSKRRSIAKAKAKLQTNTETNNSLHQKPPLQPPPKKKEKKLDSREDKTYLQPQQSPLPPPLSDQARNELLLNTSFCQYYLLPLSEL